MHLSPRRRRGNNHAAQTHKSPPPMLKGKIHRLNGPRATADMNWPAFRHLPEYRPTTIPSFFFFFPTKGLHLLVWSFHSIISLSLYLTPPPLAMDLRLGLGSPETWSSRVAGLRLYKVSWPARLGLFAGSKLECTYTADARDCCRFPWR